MFDCNDKNVAAQSHLTDAGRSCSSADSESLDITAPGRFDRRAGVESQQGNFTLVDFRSTMGQLRKLGPLQSVMKMIPGMGKIAEMMGDSNIDPEQDLKQIDGIIDSMTLKERKDPDLIDISRRRRIAEGSGTDPSDVNKLLNEFSQMAGMMQQMAGMSKWQQIRHMNRMADGGMFDPPPRP